MKNPEAEKRAEISFTREEKISRLERLIDALEVASERLAQERGAALPLGMALRAECVRCEVEVAGSDLLRLAQVPSTDDTDWLKRLRNGHCVNPRCSATNYRVHFLRHPEIEWPTLFAQGNEPTPPMPAEESETEALKKPARATLPRNELLIRIGILLLLLLTVFVIRQMYFGGRIPIVREPEKFKLGTLPPGQQEPVDRALPH